MDEILVAEHFRPHAGKTVRFKGTPYVFTLDRVEGGDGPVPSGYVRSPFVIIFRGPSKSDVMASGMYDCEIEDGPVFSLHVMPIHTPAPDRQEYQSVFS